MQRSWAWSALLLGVCCIFFAAPASSSLSQDDWQREVAKERSAGHQAIDFGANGQFDIRLDANSAADAPAQEILELLRSNQAETAALKARQLVTVYPKWASAHELLGTALALQGNVDEGMAALRQAVAIKPDQYTAITKIGDVYKFQGKSEDAKKQYLDASRLAPDDRLINQRLGLAAEEEGNTKAAIEYLEKGLSGTPTTYLGIKVDLGRLYNANREYPKAVALLQPAVQQSSSDAVAHLVLGTALAAMGKTEDAVRSFERAKAIDGSNAGYRLALGIEYRQLGSMDKSLVELAEANRLKPAWSTGLFQQAETLAAMGRHADALAQYRAAEKVAADPALIRKRIGDLQMATKDFPGAINTYKQITGKDKLSVEALSALATAYQLNGQAVEAESAYRQLVQMAPKDPMSFLRLGLFRAYERKYREALAAFNDGLSFDLKNPELLRASAMMQSRLGRHQDAVLVAERLVKAQPDTPDAHMLLAMMLEEAGERPRAKRIYESVLAKDPQNVVAQNNMAMLLSDEGKHERAIQAARRCIELKPDDPMLMDTLGWVLHRGGKSKDGLAMLSAAEAKGPSFPSIHYHLGVVHQALGDNQAARADFDKALALSDGFRDAEDARKRRVSLR